GQPRLQRHDPRGIAREGPVAEGVDLVHVELHVYFQNGFETSPSTSALVRPISQSMRSSRRPRARRCRRRSSPTTMVSARRTSIPEVDSRSPVVGRKPLRDSELYRYILISIVTI